MEENLERIAFSEEVKEILVNCSSVCIPKSRAEIMIWYLERKK